MILKTTDGGDNWDEQQSGTVRTLTSSYFINENNGFIVGDSGIILKTINGGNNIKYVDKSDLQKIKAYPNPFNKKTTIKFFQTEISPIEISIFDISGFALETIIEKAINIGENEIILDGSKYKNGTYFYHIKTKNENYSGKLILVH